MDDRKEYTAFSIPRRDQQPPSGTVSPARSGSANKNMFTDTRFSEIEIQPYPGFSSASEAAVRFFASVTPPQQIEQKPVDPIRQRFFDMRRIASDRPFARDDGELFYRQAKFMTGFTDDFEGDTKLSIYFPYYQHMGYEQLRTYFTWRTKVRKGEILPTSVSYAFLYVYELLSGIGADNPTDGLEKLVAIWDEFLRYGPVLGRYMPQWFKDYHIYYKLPHTFSEFVKEHNMYKYYPEMFLFDREVDNRLEIWNSISDYSVIGSKFYKGENRQLFRDCFNFVLDEISAFCARRQYSIEKVFIYQYNRARLWFPFRKALFYPWLKQPDRKVSLPGQERYVCKNNRWTASSPIYYSNQKYYIGYIIKKTEACLRQVLKFKYKIKVDSHLLFSNYPDLKDIDDLIEKAVKVFLIDRSRTVVTVDHANLARIRKEALGTQDKLIVSYDNGGDQELETEVHEIEPDVEVRDSELGDNGWVALKNTLSTVEMKALTILLHGDMNIKTFADENGIMLEVLVDSINEKAADSIGDSILELDDDINIFNEYAEYVAEMVGQS